MHNNNSLKYACGLRYYIRNPLKFLKETRNNIVNAYRRVTRGWGYGDVWNMDCWFYNTIPDMLDYLADHGWGYPYNEEFQDPESWKKYLHNIASDLRLCTEDAADKMNEYYEEYMNADYHSEKYLELGKKYYKRWDEITQEQEAIREEAMARLAHIMPNLWD